MDAAQRAVSVLAVASDSVRNFAIDLRGTAVGNGTLLAAADGVPRPEHAKPRQIARDFEATLAICRGWR
jgi:hypothetical protein